MIWPTEGNNDIYPAYNLKYSIVDSSGKSMVDSLVNYTTMEDYVANNIFVLKDIGKYLGEPEDYDHGYTYAARTRANVLKFKCGLLLQYGMAFRGNAVTTEATYHINFPTAFSYEPYTYVTAYCANDVWGGSQLGDYHTNITTVSKTGFYAGVPYTARGYNGDDYGERTPGIFWFAIGE